MNKEMVIKQLNAINNKQTKIVDIVKVVQDGTHNIYITEERVAGRTKPMYSYFRIKNGTTN